jgi:hypothetical protein
MPPADPTSFDSGGPYRPAEPAKRSKALPIALGLGAVAAIVVGAIIVMSGGDDDGGGAADDTELDQTVAPSQTTAAPQQTDAPGATTAAPADPTAAPTAAPTTVPPACPPTQAGACIEMTNIAIDGDSLVIEWDAYNFTPDETGDHAHFFWNNQFPAQAGTNAETFGFAQGTWELTAAQPFRSGVDPNTPLLVSRKPADATQVCVTPANAAHGVIDPAIFQCIDYPD